MGTLDAGLCGFKILLTTRHYFLSKKTADFSDRPVKAHQKSTKSVKKCLNYYCQF